MAALIVYYSRAGENYFCGALRRVQTGNTEIAAQMIHSLTGAPHFKIEPLYPYSDSYNDCIAEAQADQRAGARPELKACPENLDGYDEIYLGYPNYWGTMPMAVFAFLERYDLSGKVIHPFCTHEGSGMGRSEGDLRKLCPGAEIAPGLPIHGSSVRQAEEEIRRWIQK